MGKIGKSSYLEVAVMALGILLSLFVLAPRNREIVASLESRFGDVWALMTVFGWLPIGGCMTAFAISWWRRAVRKGDNEPEDGVVRVVLVLLVAAALAFTPHRASSQAHVEAGGPDYERAMIFALFALPVWLIVQFLVLNRQSVKSMDGGADRSPYATSAIVTSGLFAGVLALLLVVAAIKAS